MSYRNAPPKKDGWKTKINVNFRGIDLNLGGAYQKKEEITYVLRHAKICGPLMDKIPFQPVGGFRKSDYMSGIFDLSSGFFNFSPLIDIGISQEIIKNRYIIHLVHPFFFGTISFSKSRTSAVNIRNLGSFFFLRVFIHRENLTFLG